MSTTGESGNVKAAFDDVEVFYTNESGNRIAIKTEYHPFSPKAESPTELRTINGTAVRFDLYEYLHLPDEGSRLEGAILKSLRADDHFDIIYDGAHPRKAFLSEVLFENDGISYQIYSEGKADREDLFSIAQELIDFFIATAFISH